MEHLFDVEIAKKYGVNAAIVLRHLQFWIIKNKTHNTHFYDGRTWTYYSLKAFTKIFPYLTQKQIRGALETLINNSVVLKGNYNKYKNNRTTWYAFMDENTFAPEGKCVCPTRQMELPHKAKGVAPKGNSLTDVITDNPTDEKTDNSKDSSLGKLSKADAESRGYRLLIQVGVAAKIAKAIVFEHQTPLQSIEEAIKNGLAKGKYQTGFVLEPGYVVAALNGARKEGKVVSPTKLSKQFKKQVEERKKRANWKPPNEEECAERKRRLKAALAE